MFSDTYVDIHFSIRVFLHEHCSRNETSKCNLLKHFITVCSSTYQSFFSTHTANQMDTESIK